MSKDRIIYDYINGELITKDEIINFTPNENKIMKTLIENKDTFVHRKILNEKVYGKDFEEYVSYTAIATYISRIRKKIKKILAIDSKTGYGYKLRNINTYTEYNTKGQGVYEI